MTYNVSEKTGLRAECDGCVLGDRDYVAGSVEDSLDCLEDRRTWSQRRSVPGKTPRDQTTDWGPSFLRFRDCRFTPGLVTGQFLSCLYIDRSGSTSRSQWNTYRTAKMNEIIDLLLPLTSQTIVQYSKVHFNIIYDILYCCNTEWNCR